MNAKQWTLLEALAKFRFPLSVSEWSDPDVIALFNNGLVSSSMIEHGAVTTWAATDAGTNLVRLRAENSLTWQRRPPMLCAEAKVQAPCVYRGYAIAS